MRIDLESWMRSRGEGSRQYLERLIEEDMRRHQLDPVSAVPCPICKAEKGKPCLGTGGKLHGFRRQYAVYEEHLEANVKTLPECPMCKAPPGQRCRNENVHMATHPVRWLHLPEGCFAPTD